MKHIKENTTFSKLTIRYPFFVAGNQVDTYGLCVIVHMMLHNSYMAIEKKPSFDGGYIYQPKSPFKRYSICILTGFLLFP